MASVSFTLKHNNTNNIAISNNLITNKTKENRI